MPAMNLGAARLVRLRLPLPLVLRQINVYLIQGPDAVALVDTGMALPTDHDRPGHQALVQQLARVGCTPQQISQLFITHLHADHFGQAAWLQRMGCQIIMSRGDSQALQYWFQHPEFDGASLDFFRELGAPVDSLADVARSMASMRQISPAFVPDREVDDGESIELAGESFEVLVTPGHSPAHACLHHRPTRTLLVGDHVLPYITPNISVTSHIGADNPLDDYRRSLVHLRGAGFATALPAHGPPIADIDRRIDEILLHHDQREALVLSLVEQPTSCYALSEALFQISRLDGWETLMAVGETLAHLRSLVARSRVKQVQRDGVILFTSSGGPS